MTSHMFSDSLSEINGGEMSNWIDKHSINCYFCGELADERECLPADDYNNGDGGDICPKCQKTHERTTDEQG